MIRQQKKLPKRKKKIHCQQNQFFTFFFGPMGLGEALAIFLSFIFPASWIFKENKSIARFFRVISILIFCSLCWWFAKQIFVIFFGGDRSWTKNWCKLWFWSFDFGLWSFDLGVWILEFWFWGVWILEFWFGGLGLGVLILGVWILEFRFWGLDLGVLILGVWILEFWFWVLEFWFCGFGSWSFDFGGTLCTQLMFQNMRLGEQLQTPRTQPPGGGSNLVM